MRCRAKVAGSSATTDCIDPRAASLRGAASIETEDIANLARPGRQLEPMHLEQAEGDALEPEADACAVRGVAVGGADAERFPEVVEVIVARSDRGGLLRGADGHHELVLEVLLALGGLQELAAAPEERIV